MFKGLTIGAPNMAYEALDFYDVDALLTEEELMVRDMVRDWVDEKVIPNIEQHYLDGTFPREWIQDMGEMGILGMVVPEEYGCAGMSYVMEYANEIKPNEEVIEEKGVKVFIDPKAIMYLLGTEMDYKKEKFSSQFIFKNPNETERCGCGESFKV